MPTKLCEKCRRIRLVVTVLLIMFTAVAGYHWGHILENGSEGIIYPHDVAIGAIAFTVGALLFGLWGEVLVARIEKAASAAEAERARHAEAADSSKEHVRELDRIVTMLTDDNAELRHRLLANKVHQVTEDMAREEAAAPRHFARLLNIG